MYASFASTRSQLGNASQPIAMRWRSVGLQAIRSIATSESLASVSGRQLSVIMPALLENIWTDDQEYLATLIHRVRMEEKVNSEKLLRRRTSVATVNTREASVETNPLALAGSTADADKLAEEDIGVLALQCLKQVFIGNNRAQIREAAIATNHFIEKRLADGEVLLDTDPVTGNDRGWATTIFMLITRWAPVQDRYVILTTAMDKLVTSPVSEDSVQLQLVLGTMIGSLLRSDINLIGLSVMDILLGLIQHVLRILQLGNFQAYTSTTSAEASMTDFQSARQSPSANHSNTVINEKASSPSTSRVRLLARLQQCIGDLATHIYYADQINDMISAILLRLKPPTTSSIPSAVAAIEDPEGATNIISASGNITEDPNTDGFFSFDTAKVTALNAIKSIIVVANSRSKNSGASSLARKRVGLKVWEGTQWLLRDLDGRVRKAYVDTLLTWLDKEMARSDLKAFEEKQSHRPQRAPSRTAGEESGINLAKRAASNASRPDRSGRPAGTSFLELLHLAVYESAVQYAEFESDTCLLHLLLTTLVDKLGVNAVTSGLPMVFRLQEDIQEVETMAKVRLGSLCHGYFWAITEKFDLESSGIAVEIQSEIMRRRSKGFWVDMVRVPPVPLDHVGLPGEAVNQAQLPYDLVESESLRPFDNRETMVDLISIAYTESMMSPPSSPPTSPGRGFSYSVGPGKTAEKVESLPQIPPSAREAMLADWSREMVLQRAQESSKTASLNGSKAGTNITASRTFLAVNGANNGLSSGTQSPHSQNNGQRRSRPPSLAYGLVGTGMNRARKQSPQDHSPVAHSESSRNSVARVDHLKRVLAGQEPAAGQPDSHSDASSDSMVSYDGAPSEMSYDTRGVNVTELNRKASIGTGRASSRDRQTSSEFSRALTSHPAGVLSDVDEVPNGDEDVPPVPPLPPIINLSSSATLPASRSTNHVDFAASGSTSRTVSRRGKNYAGSTWSTDTGAAGAGDLESMLKGIDTKGMNGSGLGNVSRPPY